MAPVVTSTSIILCFNKHRLTQVVDKFLVKISERADIRLATNHSVMVLLTGSLAGSSDL